MTYDQTFIEASDGAGNTRRFFHDTYRKTIKLGSVSGEGWGYASRTRLPVEIEIEIRQRNEEAELSMSGSVWKPRRGDIMSGGQNYETILAMFPDSPSVARMVEIWKRWHLNGMRPDCEHQRAFYRDPCPVCGYRYGTEWKHEALPQSVIDEVRSW